MSAAAGVTASAGGASRSGALASHTAIHGWLLLLPALVLLLAFTHWPTVSWWGTPMTCPSRAA